MSLLSIVQDAAREIGLSRPGTVFGSLDFDVAQLERLANKEGRELVKRFEWQVLMLERGFVSLGQETQTAILPADFGRFVNETFFNRSKSRRFEGPLSAADWQQRKGTAMNTIVDAYRVRGNALLIMPAPAAGDAYAFEYISKYWVDTDADGQGDATAFGADAHSALFEEEIITLGVIWRYKLAKGLDYAEDFRTYEAWLARTFSHDGGKRMMDLTGRRSPGPSAPAAPDGSWPV